MSWHAFSYTKFQRNSNYIFMKKYFVGILFLYSYCIHISYSGLIRLTYPEAFNSYTIDSKENGERRSEERRILETASENAGLPVNEIYSVKLSPEQINQIMLMRCGIPYTSYDPSTVLPGNVAVNISWEMTNYIKEGVSIKIWNYHEPQKIINLAPSQSSLDDLSPVNQLDSTTYEISLPEGLECRPYCVLRVSTRFRSGNDRFNPLNVIQMSHTCARVRIAQTEAQVNCSDRGVYGILPNGIQGCQCDWLYSGKYCQYKDECYESSDCNNNGKCVDVLASAINSATSTTPVLSKEELLSAHLTTPRGVCFCNDGWFGPKCRRKSMAKAIDPSGMATLKLENGFQIYWKILKLTSEIEIILVAHTTSWVIFGWAPLDFQHSCGFVNDRYLSRRDDANRDMLCFDTVMACAQPSNLNRVYDYFTPFKTPNTIRRRSPSFFTQSSARTNSGEVERPLNDIEDLVPSDVFDLTGPDRVYKFARSTRNPRGRDNLIDASTHEENGITFVYLKKKLRAYDNTDISITNTTMNIIWAKGRSKRDARNYNVNNLKDSYLRTDDLFNLRDISSGNVDMGVTTLNFINGYELYMAAKESRARNQVSEINNSPEIEGSDDRSIQNQGENFVASGSANNNDNESKSLLLPTTDNNNNNEVRTLGNSGDDTDNNNRTAARVQLIQTGSEETGKQGENIDINSRSSFSFNDPDERLRESLIEQINQLNTQTQTGPKNYYPACDSIVQTYPPDCLTFTDERQEKDSTSLVDDDPIVTNNKIKRREITAPVSGIPHVDDTRCEYIFSVKRDKASKSNDRYVAQYEIIKFITIYDNPHNELRMNLTNEDDYTGIMISRDIDRKATDVVMGWRDRYGSSYISDMFTTNFGSTLYMDSNQDMFRTTLRKYHVDLPFKTTGNISITSSSSSSSLKNPKKRQKLIFTFYRLTQDPNKPVPVGTEHQDIYLSSEPPLSADSNPDCFYFFKPSYGKSFDAMNYLRNFRARRNFTGSDRENFYPYFEPISLKPMCMDYCDRDGRRLALEEGYSPREQNLPRQTDEAASSGVRTENSEYLQEPNSRYLPNSPRRVIQGQIKPDEFIEEDPATLSRHIQNEYRNRQESLPDLSPESADVAAASHFEEDSSNKVSKLITNENKNLLIEAVNHLAFQNLSANINGTNSNESSVPSHHRNVLVFEVNDPNANGTNSSGTPTRYVVQIHSGEEYVKDTPKTQFCTFTPDPGPCFQYSPKWFFDTNTLTCIQFAYGGCRGSLNRFDSEEQCSSVCRPILERIRHKNALLIKQKLIQEQFRLKQLARLASNRSYEDDSSSDSSTRFSDTADNANVDQENITIGTTLLSNSRAANIPPLQTSFEAAPPASRGLQPPPDDSIESPSEDSIEPPSGDLIEPPPSIQLEESLTHNSNYNQRQLIESSPSSSFKLAATPVAAAIIQPEKQEIKVEQIPSLLLTPSTPDAVLDENIEIITAVDNVPAVALTTKAQTHVTPLINEQPLAETENYEGRRPTLLQIKSGENAPVNPSIHSLPPFSLLPMKHVVGIQKNDDTSMVREEPLNAKDGIIVSNYPPPAKLTTKEGQTLTAGEEGKDGKTSPHLLKRLLLSKEGVVGEELNNFEEMEERLKNHWIALTGRKRFNSKQPSKFYDRTADVTELNDTTADDRFSTVSTTQDFTSKTNRFNWFQADGIEQEGESTTENDVKQLKDVPISTGKNSKINSTREITTTPPITNSSTTAVVANPALHIYRVAPDLDTYFDLTTISSTQEGKEMKIEQMKKIVSSLNGLHPWTRADYYENLGATASQAALDEEQTLDISDEIVHLIVYFTMGRVVWDPELARNQSHRFRLLEWNLRAIVLDERKFRDFPFFHKVNKFAFADAKPGIQANVEIELRIPRPESSPSLLFPSPRQAINASTTASGAEIGVTSEIETEAERQRNLGELLNILPFALVNYMRDTFIDSFYYRKNEKVAVLPKTPPKLTNSTSSSSIDDSTKAAAELLVNQTKEDYSIFYGSLKVEVKKRSAYDNNNDDLDLVIITETGSSTLTNTYYETSTSTINLNTEETTTQTRNYNNAFTAVTNIASSTATNAILSQSTKKPKKHDVNYQLERQNHQFRRPSSNLTTLSSSLLTPPPPPSNSTPFLYERENVFKEIVPEDLSSSNHTKAKPAQTSSQNFPLEIVLKLNYSTRVISTTTPAAPSSTVSRNAIFNTKNNTNLYFKLLLSKPSLITSSSSKPSIIGTTPGVLSGGTYKKSPKIIYKDIRAEIYGDHQKKDRDIVVLVDKVVPIPLDLFTTFLQSTTTTRDNNVLNESILRIHEINSNTELTPPPSLNFRNRTYNNTNRSGPVSVPAYEELLTLPDTDSQGLSSDRITTNVSLSQPMSSSKNKYTSPPYKSITTTRNIPTTYMIEIDTPKKPSYEIIPEKNAKKTVVIGHEPDDNDDAVDYGYHYQDEDNILKERSTKVYSPPSIRKSTTEDPIRITFTGQSNGFESNNATSKITNINKNNGLHASSGSGEISSSKQTPELRVKSISPLLQPLQTNEKLGSPINSDDSVDDLSRNDGTRTPEIYSPKLSPELGAEPVSPLQTNEKLGLPIKADDNKDNLSGNGGKDLSNNNHNQNTDTTAPRDEQAGDNLIADTFHFTNKYDNNVNDLDEMAAGPKVNVVRQEPVATFNGNNNNNNVLRHDSWARFLVTKIRTVIIIVCVCASIVIVITIVVCRQIHIRKRRSHALKRKIVSSPDQDGNVNARTNNKNRRYDIDRDENSNNRLEKADDSNHNGGGSRHNRSWWQLNKRGAAPRDHHVEYYGGVNSGGGGGDRQQVGDRRNNGDGGKGGVTFKCCAGGGLPPYNYVVNKQQGSSGMLNHSDNLMGGGGNFFDDDPDGTGGYAFMNTFDATIIPPPPTINVSGSLATEIIIATSGLYPTIKFNSHPQMLSNETAAGMNEGEAIGGNGPPNYNNKSSFSNNNNIKLIVDSSSSSESHAGGIMFKKKGYAPLKPNHGTESSSADQQASSSSPNISSISSYLNDYYSSSRRNSNNGTTGVLDMLPNQIPPSAAIRKSIIEIDDMLEEDSRDRKNPGHFGFSGSENYENSAIIRTMPQAQAQQHYEKARDNEEIMDQTEKRIISLMLKSSTNTTNHPSSAHRDLQFQDGQNISTNQTSDPVYPQFDSYSLVGQQPSKINNVVAGRPEAIVSPRQKQFKPRGVEEESDVGGTEGKPGHNLYSLTNYSTNNSYYSSAESSGQVSPVKSDRTTKQSNKKYKPKGNTGATTNLKTASSSPNKRNSRVAEIVEKLNSSVLLSE